MAGKNGKDGKNQKNGKNGEVLKKTNTSDTGTKGVIRWVEKLGNMLPHPFWIFVWICLFVVVFSAITSYFGVSATDPSSGEIVKANNLLSGEGLRRFVEEMVTNFAHFAPFGLVLVMIMGVSVAEKSGLLAAAMRKVVFAVPNKIVLPVIFIIGACGNIGSDAGVVIVPPIAALIFTQMRLNPIAGLIAGYAGATAGFTANFFIAGTDVLLAGISSSITERMGDVAEVSATANWYFMIASTVLLGIVGAFIVSKFTIPRCNKISCDMSATPENATVSNKAEKKGFYHAGIALSVYIIIIALLVMPAGAPLRDPETGGLVPSPFLRGLIPILFFFFAIPGYFYGKATGTVKKANDVLKFMEAGMKEMAGYIVLMLIVAQFINLFNWSNLDSILAISGAEFLKASGLSGPLLFVLFMIIVAILNIFMGSGSAKWAIFAPIFIPMLAQLDYNPAFVQLMYRVGDSITNCISPIYPYFPLLLGWIHKYNKNMGIGTVLSLLIPYAIILFVMWVVLLFIWFFLDLPIGVGEGIML
ncbi:MAG: AbgT family transporter [Bacteroidota bacterium]